MVVAQGLRDELEPTLTANEDPPGFHTALASLLRQAGQDLAGLVFDLPKHDGPVLFLQHEEEFLGQVQGGEQCQPGGGSLRQPNGAAEEIPASARKFAGCECCAMGQIDSHEDVLEA